MIPVSRRSKKFRESKPQRLKHIRFQNSLASQSQNMQFREFDVLFFPHFVKRIEHDAFTGITATIKFSAFREIAQQD